MEDTIKKAKTLKQCDEIEDVLTKALNDGKLEEEDYHHWMEVLRHQRVVINLHAIVVEKNANPNTPTITHDKHGVKIKTETII